MNFFAGIVLEPTEDGFRTVHFEPRIEAASPLHASNRLVLDAQLDLARAALVPLTRGLSTKGSRGRLEKAAATALAAANAPHYVQDLIAKYLLVRKSGDDQGGRHYLVAVAPHQKT